MDDDDDDNEENFHGHFIGGDADMAVEDDDDSDGEDSDQSGNYSDPFPEDEPPLKNGPASKKHKHDCGSSVVSSLSSNSNHRLTTTTPRFCNDYYRNMDLGGPEDIQHGSSTRSGNPMHEIDESAPQVGGVQTQMLHPAKFPWNDGQAWHSPPSVIKEERAQEQNFLSKAWGFTPSQSYVFCLSMADLKDGARTLGSLREPSAYERVSHWTAMLRAKAMLLSLFSGLTADGQLQNGNHMHEADIEKGQRFKYVCHDPSDSKQGVKMLHYAVEYVQDVNGKDVGIRLWMHSNDPNFRIGKYVQQQMGKALDQRMTAERSWNRKVAKAEQSNATVNRHVKHSYRNIATIEEFADVCSYYGRGTDFSLKFRSRPRGESMLYEDLTNDNHPLNPDILFDPNQNPACLNAGLVDENMAPLALDQAQKDVENYYPEKQGNNALRKFRHTLQDSIVERDLYHFLDPSLLNPDRVTLPCHMQFASVDLVKAFIDTHKRKDPDLGDLDPNNIVAKRCFNSFVVGDSFYVSANKDSRTGISSLQEQQTATNTMAQASVLKGAKIHSDGRVERPRPQDRLRKENQRIYDMIKELKSLKGQEVADKYHQDNVRVTGALNKARKELKTLEAHAELNAKLREGTIDEGQAKELKRIKRKLPSLASNNISDAMEAMRVADKDYLDLKSIIDSANEEFESHRCKLLDQYFRRSLLAVQEMIYTEEEFLPPGLVERLRKARKFFDSQPNGSAVCAEPLSDGREETLVTDNLTWFGQLMQMHCGWANGIMEFNNDFGHWLALALKVAQPVWRESKPIMQLIGAAGVGKSHLIELLKVTYGEEIMIPAGSQSATMGKNGKCQWDGAVRYFHEAPAHYSGDRKVGDTVMEDTKQAASEQQLMHGRTIPVVDENGNTSFDDAMLVTQRTEVTIVNHNSGCLASAKPGMSGSFQAMMQRHDTRTVLGRVDQSRRPQFETMMASDAGRIAHRKLKCIDAIHTHLAVVINCTPGFEASTDHASEAMARGDWSLRTQFGDQRANNRDATSRYMNLITLVNWTAAYELFCIPEHANKIAGLAKRMVGNDMHYPKWDIEQLMYIRQYLHPTPEQRFMAHFLEVAQRIPTAAVVHHVTVGLAKMMGVDNKVLYQRPSNMADEKCRTYIEFWRKFTDKDNKFMADWCVRMDKEEKEKVLLDLEEVMVQIAEVEELSDEHLNLVRNKCKLEEELKKYEKQEHSLSQLQKKIDAQDRALIRRVGVDDNHDEALVDPNTIEVVQYDEEYRIESARKMATRRLAVLENMRGVCGEGPVSGVSDVESIVRPTYQELRLLYPENEVQSRANDSQRKQALPTSGLTFLKRDDNTVDPMWIMTGCKGVESLAKKLASSSYMYKIGLGKEVIHDILVAMIEMIKVETRGSTAYEPSKKEETNDTNAAEFDLSAQFPDAAVPTGLRQQTLDDCAGAARDETRADHIIAYNDMQRNVDRATTRNDFPAMSNVMSNAGEKREESVLLQFIGEDGEKHVAVNQVYLMRAVALDVESRVAVAQEHPELNGHQEWSTTAHKSSKNMNGGIVENDGSGLPNFYNLVLLYKMGRVLKDTTFAPTSSQRHFVTPVNLPHQPNRLMTIQFDDRGVAPKAVYKKMMEAATQTSKRTFGDMELACLTGVVQDDFSRNELNSLVSDSRFFDDHMTDGEGGDLEDDEEDALQNDPWAKNLSAVFKEKGIIQSDNLSPQKLMRELYTCKEKTRQQQKQSGRKDHISSSAVDGMSGKIDEPGDVPLIDAGMAPTACNSKFQSHVINAANRTAPA